MSTFQETVSRVTDAAIFTPPVVVTSYGYRFAVADQLEQIGAEAQIVLEPEPRESGPATAAGAAFIAGERGDDAPVLSLAADHMISDVEGFRAACKEALAGAEAGYIVTFGVSPKHPGTEYGYIAPGRVFEGRLSTVDHFKEKPDSATAETYLRKGFLWNSGNFLFLAGTLAREYAAQDAMTARSVIASVRKGTNEAGFVRLDAESFGCAVRLSLDRAVLEKTAMAAVLPVSFDWSDVGSWGAVRDLWPRDECGNAAKGLGIFVDASDNIVATDSLPVAVVGLRNAAVIVTSDVVLVADCNAPGGIKTAVERIGRLNRQLT
jgi:mannose-1-phosphate guanylyltransferase/mannose-6-phosphate isomerase